MRERQFESLRLELLRSGVTPVYVERTILELADHYCDLESAALAAGLDADEATRVARDTLGNGRFGHPHPGCDLSVGQPRAHQAE